jgi:hypothetical protein
MLRVPDAMRREVPLRKAGTYQGGWTPGQQRAATLRCIRGTDYSFT